MRNVQAASRWVSGRECFLYGHAHLRNMAVAGSGEQPPANRANGHAESQPSGLDASATEAEPVQVAALRRPLFEGCLVWCARFFALAGAGLLVPRRGHMRAVGTVQEGDRLWSATRQHKPFWVLGQPIRIAGVAVGKAIDAPAHPFHSNVVVPAPPHSEERRSPNLSVCSLR